MQAVLFEIVRDVNQVSSGDMYTDIITFIRDNIPVIQFIFLFVSFIMFGVIVYLNSVLGLTREKIDHYIDVVGSKNISRRNQLKVWQRVEERLKSGTPQNLRLAVIDADNVLSEILKVSRFPGITMDERLAAVTEAEIPNIGEVLEAHKLRHRLAKDSTIVLTQEEAENAVNIYKKVFVDLGLIEG